jgi:hypothetical protein
MDRHPSQENGGRGDERKGGPARSEVCAFGLQARITLSRVGLPWNSHGSGRAQDDEYQKACRDGTGPGREDRCDGRQRQRVL